MKKVLTAILAVLMLAVCIFAMPMQTKAATKLAITQQPASVVLPKGSAVKLTIDATGDGLTYKWYYKNKGAKSFKYTDLFPGNIYTTTMGDKQDGRQLYCVVTDCYGNTVKSNVATLTMGNPATITQQPESVILPKGSAVKLTVGATGDGLTYKWYYKNKGAKAFKYTDLFPGNVYTTTLGDKQDGRQLYCVITDKYGNSVKSDVATLTMAPAIKITQQPVSVTLPKGGAVKLTVGATGDGLTYKWYYKNKGAKSFKYTDLFPSNIYTTTMGDNQDGRQLYCVVTDKYGKSVKTNTVTISMKNVATITKQPESVVLPKGSAVKLTVGATGDGLTYKWYYKNKGAASFKYTDLFPSNIYTTTLGDKQDGRQLYCVITDKYGNSVKTNVVTLTMEVTVKITQQPESVMLPKGSAVKLTIGATGEGLTYKWYYKNKTAASFKYTDLFPSNIYTTTMGDKQDGRQLYCIVTDKYGYSVKSDVATLTMGTPLKITTQPKAVNAEDGYKATVSIEAQGDELRYEWYYKNGTSFVLDTAAATNTYSVTMNATVAGRQIYCVVSDRHGNSQQSDTVTLGRLPYKTVYYGANGNIRCVELVNVPFVTTDRVDWSFEKVGTDDKGDYGFATENVLQADTPIVNWYYGDDTYLTQYKDAKYSDLEDLLTGLVAKGYTINSRSQLNEDCYSISLTRQNGNCHISYFVHTQEIYLTVSQNRAFSPHLQERNSSTQSSVISGATTKLTMLPSEDAGDCYVIQLKNGNFIVFDGGASKTLVTLLDYLEANTPAGKIPVVEAWFITHGHFDHCGWSVPFYATTASDYFQAGEAASRVRVNGVYFNQTAEQNWEQTVFAWRSDTPDTGWRTKTGNPWPPRVKQAIAKMKTASGEATPMYRPQAGQIYYFCGLQVEVPYAQEQIPFCDYQMDLNASSTWYLVRSSEGRTFLDAGDTENVNMEYVVEAYSPNYDIYKENLDIMSIFHHGHNLYSTYKDVFRAPILFLPSAGERSWSGEATTVYRYYTTPNGTRYKDLLTNSWKRNGLGLPLYHYGESAQIYDFSTGKITTATK